MNMFLHELKAYRKSTIIWTCSLITMVILFLAMYPAIAKDAADFKKMIENYPPALMKALGFSIDNFFSLLGFYSSFTLTYILLCGSIQAMNLGTSIISKEVREKTADFLLTKPVRRSQIMTAKLLAVITSLVITNVIYIVGASLMALAVQTEAFSYKLFFMLSITVFFVQLMFLSLGILVSVLVPKIKSVLPISLGTVFSFFIISMLSSSIGNTTSRFITPFKYFDMMYILNNSAYEVSYIIVELLFIVTAITASYIIYSKKDIHSV
jgi:ABC-2 type transport system permease protein